MGEVFQTVTGTQHVDEPWWIFVLALVLLAVFVIRNVRS